jgi:hypothetical protein
VPRPAECRSKFESKRRWARIRVDDAIVAHVDDENQGVQDAAEPFDTGTKTWLPGEPVFLTLTPKADQNIVNEQHCLQAYVTDIFLNPNPDEPVRFV